MSPSIAYSSAADRAQASPAQRGDAPAHGVIEVAPIGVQLAAQQREQARFAGAVRAEEPILSPGLRATSAVRADFGAADELSWESESWRVRK